MDKTILVIDDDIRFMQAIKMIIQTGERKVLTAYNVKEAIEILKTHSEQVDLICSDYSLTGGRTVMEILLFIRESRLNIPLIVISGEDEGEYAERVKAVGAIEYYSKDALNVQKIRNIVNRLLDGIS